MTCRLVFSYVAIVHRCLPWELAAHSEFQFWCKQAKVTLCVVLWLMYVWASLAGQPFFFLRLARETMYGPSIHDLQFMGSYSSSCLDYVAEGFLDKLN